MSSLIAVTLAIALHPLHAPQLDRYCPNLCCDRLGAACDFRIVGLESDRLVEWILEQQLPFDSLYYYGSDRPIHISYAPKQRQSIWAFTDRGVPTWKGIENWIEAVKRLN